VTNVLRADGILYAAIRYGHFGPKLHRSDDDGRTWKKRLRCRHFLPMPPMTPSLFQIWTLEAGGRKFPDRLWIGAIPAGLFRSDDRGETW
jgi:hypothetical protein